MNKWLAKHIRELDKEGITFIPNGVSKKKCNYYINRFEIIINNFTALFNLIQFNFI